MSPPYKVFPSRCGIREFHVSYTERRARLIKDPQVNISTTPAVYLVFWGKIARHARIENSDVAEQLKTKNASRTKD